MSLPVSIDDVPEGLGATLRKQGFETLTAVQQAVLGPDLAGRDLRISSQTGSGKTVALGLLLASHVAEAARERSRGKLPARPVALLIAPTRELAGQLSRELTWLYAPLNARVAVVTGGTHMGREKDELRRDPHVLIGTPGRLLDHLRGGNIELSSLKAVALDEADEMLAMNFEEDLNAILEHAPKERTTHLVSATFPREVTRLADRMQSKPAMVEGTVLGQANTDIEHILMWVEPRARYDAAINILLRYPEDKALLFVRTRADTTELASVLNEAGLRARALSGEMTQSERTQTFNAFRTEGPWILVATDVAARGLDVQDIARVIQVDLPENADVLTHRSGRTGRAGRTGMNILIAPPRATGRVRSLLRSARIEAKEMPVPTREDILEAADDRVFGQIPEDLDSTLGDDAKRLKKLAARILKEREPADVVAWLLGRAGAVASSAARKVQGGAPPKGSARGEDARPARGGDRPASHGTRSRREPGEDFVTFQISWGGMAGADPRRILAMVCRRGDITSAEVGAIHVTEKSSSVDIASSVAERFEEAVKKPDDRPPKAKFRRWDPNGGPGPSPRGLGGDRRPEGPRPARGFGGPDAGARQFGDYRDARTPRDTDAPRPPRPAAGPRDSSGFDRFRSQGDKPARPWSGAARCGSRR
jgi:ATP-dependent RNA helicase DeaD